MAEEYYHYTDKESKDKILESGRIKAGEGVFGRGVYMTTKPPSEGKKEISRNNYDDSATYWEKRESKGSADYAIKVTVPKDKVEKAPTGRDVYYHKGDITLKDYKHAVEKVGKETVGKKTVGKETVDKETVGKKTVGKKTVGKETVDKETVGKKTVGKETVGKKTVGKETVGKKTVGKETVGKKK